MRLKNIKLSGFKSFVDPTTIPFEQNLIAVVGPNGCGKSNIVDAIRWVMGESSVKTLRGESMTDVIFNGSTTRKPVGQASVQLTFDNSDGTIGGEYAEYNEIVIKRVASRDSTSNYFLNNVRCRRKDITDIFLGTGLGVGSYSVIEQGMISRFIEAKPDDLRVYIEEAAGISKYKERRRETENRIRHTRENLDCVNTLREEISARLEKLQGEAKAAEHYKMLKQDACLNKAQWQALHWQILEQQIQHLDEVIKAAQAEIEQQVAQQQHCDSEIKTLRTRQTDVSNALNEVQGYYYSLGADLAKIEQSIIHHGERHQQLQEDKTHIERSSVEIKQNIQADQHYLSELQQQLARLEPEFDRTKLTAEQSNAMLIMAEEKMASHRTEWDEFATVAAQTSQIMKVEQTRMQHTEQIIKQVTSRIEKYSAEAATINSKELNDAIEKLVTRLQQAEIQLADQKKAFSVVNAEIQQLRANSETTGSQLDVVKESLQQAKGRRASLMALQQAALGKENEVVVAWLEKNKLQQKPRLAQQLQVDSGWEKAVEIVLGAHLQAICVDNYDVAEKLLNQLPIASFEFFINGDDVGTVITDTNEKLLSSKIRANKNVVQLLANIYCVDSLVNAKKILSKLDQHQSVITKDGLWLSQQWLRVAKNKDTKSGILQSKRQLRELDMEIKMLEARSATLQAQLQQQKHALVAAEQHKETLQQQCNMALQTVTEIRAEEQIHQQRLQQLRQRQQQLAAELNEQQQLLQRQQQLLAQVQIKWQQASSSSQDRQQKKDELQTAGKQCRQRWQQAREQAQQDADIKHRLEVQLEQLKPQLETLIASIARNEKQRQMLRARSAKLSQLLQGERPIAKLQTELEQISKRRLAVEHELTEVRSKVESITHQLRELEENKENIAQKIEKMRRNLQEKTLQQRTVDVRKKTYEEQLTKIGYRLDDILQNLPKKANIAIWEEEAQRIANRISRLGAINLAAIDECKVQAERKQYLDSQYDDLMTALTTLENAIHKIDQEIRTRFKQTFDKINDSFKRLFPRVFGGGSAYLELIGEDILNTGISVMACPPGKRNTTIHLLSGGEKALTAISLVFAIFHLNPAPFCLLDEVDAPLDDANVGRFCILVKEIAEKVQFLFISHNKLAIEMANQLTGVTMQEPGVSRIVAVDVEKAVKLAAA